MDLLYPVSCEVCKQKLTNGNGSICEGCFKKIKKRKPPFCIRCGKCIPGEPDSKQLCIDCKKASPYFDRAFSVCYYEDPLKKLVHDFKYNKRTALLKDFLDLIMDSIKTYEIDKNIDLVLPVPMHPVRLFLRETNPSHILAKEVAKRLGIPYSHNLLFKTKNTRPQSRLKRPERIKNPKHSFSIRKNRLCEVQNKNILIVDDLFTTGATVNECAGLLKKAKANYVAVITLARGDRPV